MTGVRQTKLMKLGKVAICSAPSRTFKILASISLGNERLKLSCCADNYKLFNFSPTLYLSCSDSSTFHQRFNRDSYESKRSKYQRQNSYRRKTNSNEFSAPTLESNHYDRLQVSPDADLATIKSAYYSLSKLYHPDTNKDSSAVENFRLITESYNVLGDPESRAEYDRELSPPQPSPTETFWTPSGNRSRYDQVYRFRDAEKIFKRMQEAALEREKLRNPQKFRAGSFKKNDDFDRETELEKLRQQIKAMNAHSSLKTGRRPTGDFYRMHLYDTIQRRYEDIQDMEAHRSQDANNPETPVIVVLGVLTFSVIFFVYTFTNVDIAASLDERLSRHLRERGAKEEQVDYPITLDKRRPDR